MKKTSDPVRIGVLGCGMISQAAHFESCQRARNARLYAICDAAAISELIPGSQLVSVTPKAVSKAAHLKDFTRQSLISSRLFSDFVTDGNPGLRLILISLGKSYNPGARVILEALKFASINSLSVET